MKKTIKITMLTGLVTGMLLISCKKELNVLPTTSQVDGNVIVDTKSAATVLNGVYFRFANSGIDVNSVKATLWDVVHEYTPAELCGLLIPPNGTDDFSTVNLTAVTTGVETIWNYSYSLVNAANGFLKNIDPVSTIPDATKKQMIAEAKFLRAFGNATLLLYYGQYYDPSSKYGIILHDKFVSSDDIRLPRSTVADTYSSILSDLDAAITDLPAQNTTKYYANASAARLLKARVLINRAANGDYAQVISLTNDVITKGPFTLEASTKDIFLTKGFTSSEVILGIQPYATQNQKFLFYNSYGFYQASPVLVDLFSNDPRNQWVYKNDNKTTLYARFYNSAINEITKYYSGTVTSTPVQTTLSEYAYAFRLSEAYLLQAEAIAASGGDLNLAKTQLKTVMSKAGVTNFTEIDNTQDAAALKILIIKEIFRNNVSENGTDWFALRRLPLAEIKKIQPFLTSTDKFLLPIPQVELNRNNMVIQNPGY